MKNYNQSKKAKIEFLKKNTIAMYMRDNEQKVFTREELCELFNLSDRVLRENIAEMANYLPVISLSNSTGYKVLSFNEETTIEELNQMLDEIQHQINEFKSRIDNLKARMKPLVALQKVIEKKIAN